MKTKKILKNKTKRYKKYKIKGGAALANIGDLMELDVREFARGTSKTIYEDPRLDSNQVFITISHNQLKNSGMTREEMDEFLQDELNYTRFLHDKFDYILDAEELSPTNVVHKNTLMTTNGSKLEGFVSKKIKAPPVTADSPGIFEFILETVFDLMDAYKKDGICFVNLDIKLQNICYHEGKEGPYKYLDNGPDLFYPISKYATIERVNMKGNLIHFHLTEYFRVISIIIGIKNLGRRLTPRELHILSSSPFFITRDIAIYFFNVKLFPGESRSIRTYAKEYFARQRLGSFAEHEDCLMPDYVVRYYCCPKDDKSQEAFERTLDSIGLV